jgi:hypothetical protein
MGEVNAYRAGAQKAEAAPAADVADALDDVARLDVGGDDLRKKRGEHEEVVLAHQPELDVGAAAKAPFQIDNRFEASEATAEDYNALGLGLHRWMPLARRWRTAS